MDQEISMNKKRNGIISAIRHMLCKVNEGVQCQEFDGRLDLANFQSFPFYYKSQTTVKAVMEETGFFKSNP